MSTREFRALRSAGRGAAPPPPRAPQRADLSCAHRSAGGGLRGNPRRGFPLLFVLWVCACAPIRWVVVDGLSCLSTPFLWCLPKETVSSRQRKALFYPGGSTIRVSATASVDGGHLRPTWGRAGGHLSGCLRRGRTGFVMAALRGQSTARASLSLSGSAHLQKRVSLGLHPVSLRKSKEMGWNWQ